MEYCEGHLDLMTALARIEERQIAQNEKFDSLDKRINGTVDDVKDHIRNSRPRNVAICVALVTVAVFLYNQAIILGENKNQIKVNTKTLEQAVKIERKNSS